MKYTPSELAGEIGASKEWIYQAIKAGLPHRRDDTGHLWIVGTEFRAWALANCAKRQKVAMQPGQAWCFTCKAAREMVEPFTVEISNKNLERLCGFCAECGRKVSRARKRDG